MKIRGWLLMAAAVALSAQCAFAASTVQEVLDAVETGDFLESDGTVSEENRSLIVQTLADVNNADVEVVDAALRGDVMSAYGRVAQDAAAAGWVVTPFALPATPTPIQQKNYDFIMWTVNNAAGVGGQQYAADLIALNGDYAVAGAQTGLMQGKDIAFGSGSVVNNRLAGLLAERKGLGNDTALAAFRMNENFANRIWASPFYSYHDMDVKDGKEGYKYKAWGASLGYDRAFGAMTVGASFTYARGDYDAKNVHDDNTIDNYGFSLYAQYYNCNGFFADLTGGYNYGDNEWKRTTAYGQLRGDNHTNTYWIGGKIGKDFFLGENWTLTPSVGLYWFQAESSAYRTAGAAFQNIGKIKEKSLMLPIDLTAQYTQQLGDCSSISFKVGGGYAYDFKNDGAKGHMGYDGLDAVWGTTAIQGVKPGRSSWNVGGGITYRKNNFDIGVDYRYNGRKKYDGHRVSATVGWSF